MNNRNRLIQLIHVGKRELGLDDDTYRAMLENVTGKTSCSKMSIQQLELVLASMENQGFKRQVNGKQTTFKKRLSPKAGRAKHGEIDVIRAVWITMAKHGIVRDGSETALDAYVRRMTNRNKGQGVDTVAWCSHDQAYQVLESLKSWHRRELIKQMKAKGWTVPMNTSGTAPAGYDAVLEAYEFMTSSRTVNAE